VEGFFASLFESCQILFNGTPLTRTSSSLYSYKYFLETLLGYGPNAADSFLKSEIWYLDSSVNQFTTASNAAFASRLALSTASKPVELIGRVAEGICSQGKLIPNNVEIKLTLRRSKPAFSLCGATVARSDSFPYKIDIEEAVWMIKRHAIHPRVLNDHQSLLSSRRFNIPFTHNEVKSFLIPTGTLSVISETIFACTIPSYCVIGLVSAAAFNGSVTTSLFTFQPFNISSVTLTCDSNSVLYRQINFDTDKGVFLQGYNSLLSILPHKELGSMVTRDNYIQSKFLVALDLADPHSTTRFHYQRHGQIKVELRFKSATTESLMCIILGSFQLNTQIDKDRNIYSDATLV
jgi:hypothetical protein